MPPYPTMVTQNKGKDKSLLVITLSVPVQCIDEQSHAMTHDQLKHLTGKALAEEYRRRRKELEDQNNASGYTDGKV